MEAEYYISANGILRRPCPRIAEPCGVFPRSLVYSVIRRFYENVETLLRVSRLCKMLGIGYTVCLDDPKIGSRVS